MAQPHRPTRAVIHADLTGVATQGPQTFDTLYRVAQACYASGLFEDVADEAQAFVKILKGQEMGLPPTTAMSAFDLIRKRLFIKPWVIAAKINTCGYGSYRVVELNDERCMIVFSRRTPGQGWADCPAISYTFAEAKGQGLTDRSAHWKASPAHMLYQRCMGRGGAMYFPELLAGLEPPQEETPIPEARHRQNIIDLFGDEAVNVQTGEIVAREGGQRAAREAPGAGSNDRETAEESTETSSQGRQPLEAAGSLKNDCGENTDAGAPSWGPDSPNLFEAEERAARDAGKEGAP